jgi:hypothetical protein
VIVDESGTPEPEVATEDTGVAASKENRAE